MPIYDTSGHDVQVMAVFVGEDSYQRQPSEVNTFVMPRLVILGVE